MKVFAKQQRLMESQAITMNKHLDGEVLGRIQEERGISRAAAAKVLKEMPKDQKLEYYKHAGGWAPPGIQMRQTVTLSKEQVANMKKVYGERAEEIASRIQGTKVQIENTEVKTDLQGKVSGELAQSDARLEQQRQQIQNKEAQLTKEFDERSKIGATKATAQQVWENAQNLFKGDSDKR